MNIASLVASGVTVGCSVWCVTRAPVSPARVMVFAYILFLIFSLFAFSRTSFLSSIMNPVNAGFPLPEKDYGDVCDVYVPNHPSGNPFFNLTDRIDVFVIAHAFGWFVKTLILRDLGVAWVCSILFELTEVCFAHLLPNFNECWWDSIILDVFGCNLIGIHLAYFCVVKLGFKPFDFLSNGTSKNAGDNEKRSKFLFSSFLLILLITLIDLNFFFLKFVFFVPTTHWLAFTRTLLWIAVSAPSAVELHSWSSAAVAREGNGGGMVPGKSSRLSNAAMNKFVRECPTCTLGLIGLLVEIAFYYNFRDGLFAKSPSTPLLTILTVVTVIYATGWSWLNVVHNHHHSVRQTRRDKLHRKLQ